MYSFVCMMKWWSCSEPGNLKSVAYRQAMESFIEYHMAEMENRDKVVNADLSSKC